MTATLKGTSQQHTHHHVHQGATQITMAHGHAGHTTFAKQTIENAKLPVSNPCVICLVCLVLLRDWIRSRDLNELGCSHVAMFATYLQHSLSIPSLFKTAAPHKMLGRTQQSVSCNCLLLQTTPNLRKR
uniref:Uncharacterized protein n=1 Tax=Eutreptiella gymnastica TaxID=73025 RepID=A0A7S4LB98_9EUGL|mmetsp:Transcript_49982/g.83806  ORF Transcript_49982/g.83806 Transcript_49982/m.83806 type:complete len:129 (-) Transcript_49982:1205-1591(-)